MTDLKIPKLPRVHENIISAVRTEFDPNHPQYDSGWANVMMDRLRIENPVVGFYIDRISVLEGEESNAASICLFLYRILESQLEANHMEGMFDES